MRLSDWPQRLSAYLAEPRPFAYGVNDCALFAAGAVEALTGDDPGEAFRNEYADYRTGLALAGVKRLRQLADSRFPVIPGSLAHRGDLAWVIARTDADRRLRGCFMVVDGAVLVGPGGVRLPRSAGHRFWRVD